MTCRIANATMAAFLLLTPAPCVAQTAVPTTSTEVTFKVPLNLTQMPSDISRVAVMCAVMSPVITTSAVVPAVGGSNQTQSGTSVSETSWPVQGGQVVLTMVVVVPVTLAEPAVGKAATYGCGLRGFSNSLQRWDYFDAASTIPAFRLPSAPFVFSGSLVW